MHKWMKCKCDSGYKADRFGRKIQPFFSLFSLTFTEKKWMIMWKTPSNRRKCSVDTFLVVIYIFKRERFTSLIAQMDDFCLFLLRNVQHAAGKLKFCPDFFFTLKHFQLYLKLFQLGIYSPMDNFSQISEVLVSHKIEAGECVEPSIERNY